MHSATNQAVGSSNLSGRAILVYQYQWLRVIPLGHSYCSCRIFSSSASRSALSPFLSLCYYPMLHNDGLLMKMINGLILPLLFAFTLLPFIHGGILVQLY